MNRFKLTLDTNTTVLDVDIKNIIIRTIESNIPKLVDINFTQSIRYDYTYFISCISYTQLTKSEIETVYKILNDEAYCYLSKQTIIWDCSHIESSENSIAYI